MSGFVTVAPAPQFHMPAVFRRTVERVQTALVERRNRRELAQMDDRMLSDIGASRSDAVMEASRPLWDQPELNAAFIR